MTNNDFDEAKSYRKGFEDSVRLIEEIESKGEETVQSDRHGVLEGAKHVATLIKNISPENAHYADELLLTIDHIEDRMRDIGTDSVTIFVEMDDKAREKVSTIFANASEIAQ